MTDSASYNESNNKAISCSYSSGKDCTSFSYTDSDSYSDSFSFTHGSTEGQ